MGAADSVRTTDTEATNRDTYNKPTECFSDFEVENGIFNHI